MPWLPWVGVLGPPPSHRGSEGKSEREVHVLPNELKSNAMKKCIGGNTFYIVKEVEADKGTRKVEITQEFKGSIQTTFK